MLDKDGGNITFEILNENNQSSKIINKLSSKEMKNTYLVFGALVFVIIIFIILSLYYKFKNSNRV